MTFKRLLEFLEGPKYFSEVVEAQECLYLENTSWGWSSRKSVKFVNTLYNSSNTSWGPKHFSENVEAQEYLSG